MIIFYKSISVGLENKDFYLQVRRYIPCMLSVYLLQYFTRKSIFSKEFLGHLMVGAMWIFTYPILYYMTYHNSVTYISSHRDILFGLYLMVLLSALHYLFSFYFVHKKWVTGLFSLIDLGLIILPVLQLVYYQIYGLCISEAALMAVYQTNINEGIEFIFTYVGIGGLVGISLLISLLFVFFYKFNVYLRYMYVFNLSKSCKLGTLFLVFALGIYLPNQLFATTGVMAYWNDISEYFTAAQQYERNHSSGMDNLIVNTNKPIIETVPGTIIVIIGESESRNFMSAYTETERDTTPWLRSQRDNKNFILFENAYSCWNQTVPVLERALTESSQYNTKKFYESNSFIDIAKKLGYYTSWFSNQGTIGSADTPITLVANTTDNAKWTSQSVDTIQYDDELLRYLATVDPSKNNFIVLHLMGSHGNYKNRFPPNSRKWGDESENNTVDDYDNSLLHTDTVIANVYEYARKNLNLQAMLYFSDHGEGIKRGHHPDIIDFKTLRIPMYLYLSDNYIAHYPERATNLRSHKNAFFSNDMIYDTICGILNVESPHYDVKQDFSSEQYDFTEDNTTVMLGKYLVKDDPYLR